MSAPAPLLAPSSDGLASTLARDWAVQVNDGDYENPEWVFVLGLSQFAPKNESTMQDDGDINSGGYASEIATEIKTTIEAEGLRKGTAAAGNFIADPGQEILRKKGEVVGSDNFADIRYWRTDGRPEAKRGNFAVKWTDGSEGKDGLSSFSLSLSARGKPQDIEKPRATVSGGAGSDGE